jgi:signal transduction histidine kinase
MTREEALAGLKSRSPHVRLKSARAIAGLAAEEDLVLLQAAIATESVPWVRAALARAIDGVRTPKTSDSGNPPPALVSDEARRQIQIDALRESATLLLHEIAPLLGTIRLQATNEIPDFQQSRTAACLDRLEALLDSIAILRNAAKAPIVSEFDISEVVRQIATDVLHGREVMIQFGGPSPFMMTADKTLIRIAISNALRNSVEATEGVPGAAQKPIIVTWESNALDYWIVVLDSGGGLGSASVDRLFDIGTTTKLHHFGMGLAATRQAIWSLGGTVVISPRESGVHFEVRWPKSRRVSA